MSDRPGPNAYAESVAGLRALANRWALTARDHARESKARSSAGDETKAAYYRGLAETYHKLAMELAEGIKQLPANAPAAAPAVNAPLPAPAPAQAPPAAPASSYAPVPLSEALRMLDYAGVNARDVKQHKDNAFTAIFSRWQPFSESERLDRIKSVDPRIIILGNGKLPDTHDPYVDFAFQS
jgi:hypothetical protein